MWTRRFDGPGTKRFAFDRGAIVDVLTEGTSAEMAAIRVTVAAGSRLGEPDHGTSDALLLPLAGRLTLRDRTARPSSRRERSRSSPPASGCRSRTPADQQRR